MFKRVELSGQVDNQALLDGYRQHQDADDITRTHLFNGRYENIYLDESRIPELNNLLTLARHHACQLLGEQQLHSGYWFNDMPPGAVTTLHNHDTDDELLSAAYYIVVPENSGDLILHDQRPPSRISPHAGELILFPPDLDHEVSRNDSEHSRLSIGINFGPPR